MASAELVHSSTTSWRERPPRGAEARLPTHEHDGWHFLAPLWDDASAPWFVLDPTGELAYTNEAFDHIFGSGSWRSTPESGDLASEQTTLLARTAERLRRSPRARSASHTIPVRNGNGLALMRANFVAIPVGSSGCVVIGTLVPCDSTSESPMEERVRALERVLERIRSELECVAPVEAPPITKGEFSLLSSRQQEVAFLIAADRSMQEIAEDLFVSVNTVRNHAKAIYRKLGVHSQHELIARYRAVIRDLDIENGAVALPGG